MPIIPPQIQPAPKDSPTIQVQFFRKGQYQIEQHRQADNVLAPASYWFPYTAQVQIQGGPGQVMPMQAQVMIPLQATTVDEAFDNIPDAVASKGPVLIEGEVKRQIDAMRAQARDQALNGERIVRVPGRG